MKSKNSTLSKSSYSTSKPITYLTISIRLENSNSLILKYAKKYNLNISLGDIVLYSVAKCLPQFPELNSNYDKRLILFKKINLGYVINVGKGSKVAVIEKSSEKSLEQISKKIKNIALQCLREKFTQTSDYTFLITNLSSFKVDMAIPPLMNDVSSVLAINSEYMSTELLNNSIKAFKTFKLTLSYDSRIADCQRTLEFLDNIRKTIESTKNL